MGKKKPCKPKPRDTIWDSEYSQFLRDYFANAIQVICPVHVK